MATNTTVTTDKNVNVTAEPEKPVTAEPEKPITAEPEKPVTAEPPDLSSESSMEQAENATREALAEQETMTVIINAPSDAGANWEGIVNGVMYAFPFNTTVEIPRTLYDLIRSTNTITDQTAALEKAAENMRKQARKK